MSAADAIRSLWDPALGDAPSIGEIENAARVWPAEWGPGGA